MELTITNFNGIETIDSRLIAENIGKNHKELLRDIRTYCNYLDESNNGLVEECKITLTDFFIESTYTTSQNKVMPCYLCTRKGCEMIADKMAGAKGTDFTAMYVNAFWKNIILSKAAEMISGEELLPLPESEKTYSATEIGEMFGISAQKVDKIANANGMKTSEYGKFYKDKSKYSNKEVDTFRYDDKAIEKFKEIFN